MILKCPNCGEQYELSSSGKIENFTMKCQSCGTVISSEENEEVEVRRLGADRETVIIKEKKSGSGCLWTFVVILILLGVMVVTRPEKARHAEKIREIGTELINQKAAGQDKLTQGLAFLIGPSIIDLFLSSGLQIDDYIIFNVGRIKFNDIDRPVTIGVFNTVIPLVSREKINELSNQPDAP